MNQFSIVVGGGGWWVIGPVDADQWDFHNGVPGPASVPDLAAGPFKTYSEAEAEVRRMVQP